jgi:hypothetical protein
MDTPAAQFVSAPFGEARAGEVHCEDGDVERQQHAHGIVRVHAAAAVAVQEDDAGQRLGGVRAGTGGPSARVRRGGSSSGGITGLRVRGARRALCSASARDARRARATQPSAGACVRCVRGGGTAAPRRLRSTKRETRLLRPHFGRVMAALQRVPLRVAQLPRRAASAACAPRALHSQDRTPPKCPGAPAGRCARTCAARCAAPAPAARGAGRTPRAAGG